MKIWINVFCGVALGIAILVAVLVWIPKLFAKLSLLVGLLVWLFLVSFLYAFVPMIGTWNQMFEIFVYFRQIFINSDEAHLIKLLSNFNLSHVRTFLILTIISFWNNQ